MLNETIPSIEELKQNKLLVDLPIITIFGPILSGKNTAAAIIQDQFGFPGLTYSRLIKDSLAKQGKFAPYEREDLWSESRRLMQIYGDDALTRLAFVTALNESVSTSNKGMVLDGIREPADAIAFKSLPNKWLIWLESEDPIRFSRAKARNRPEDMIDFAQFVKQDAIENARSNEAKKYADVFITNNGSQAELKEKLLDVVTTFLSIG